MDTKAFLDLFAYSANCRNLLCSTLLQHPEVFDRPFQTLSNHTSIRGLIMHLIGSEERWVETRIGGRTIERYEQHPATEIPGFFADWERVRAGTQAYLESLGPANLAQRYLITVPQWQFEEEMTAGQILFHILNHETHHRAQISMALQQMQIDPPNFDYMFLHG